jgi:hypothetical protein
VSHHALTNTDNALLSSVALQLQSSAQRVKQLHDAANAKQYACSCTRNNSSLKQYGVHCMTAAVLCCVVFCYLCEAAIYADDLPSDVASTSHTQECY